MILDDDTYVDKTLDTNNDTENTVVVETDGVVIDESEICHKNFKKKRLKYSFG